MGDIHENCLSQWVSTSNKHQCEICKVEYAKTGWSFKKLSLWKRPKVEGGVSENSGLRIQNL